MSERDYMTDPRTCTACGQDLFPNYMEGKWEHFAKDCKFTGHSALSVATGTEVMIPWNCDSPEMVGAWKSERISDKAAKPKK